MDKNAVRKTMVTASYSDKESGAPRCIVAPISEGISKKTGKPFCIVDTDRREVIEADYAVGTILFASTSYAVQETSETTQDHRSLKIGSKQ